MKRILYTCCLILTFLFSYAQPGSLDPGFNGTGKVLTSFYYDFGNGPEIMGQDGGYAMAVQADGKIVVAGSTYNGIVQDFGLTRYNTNGSLDNTFGNGGTVHTSFGPSNVFPDNARAIVIQGDGKILVAGTVGAPVITDFALVRYNTDGSLDNSFGNNGIVLTDFGDVDNATSIAIQTDGKIVVAGYSVNGSDVDFSLARYNTDGSLDNTFDGDGKLITVFSPRTDEIYAITIQSDGKIVVAGRTDNAFKSDFALARYNTDGSLDNNFDGDGKVITAMSPVTGQAQAIGIQSDGKIVVAGYAYTFASSNIAFALARYNTNGSLDNSFDGDGKVTTTIGSSEDNANALAIQSDGKIVVAGYKGNAASPYRDFALARYNSNGSLDVSFDGDGKVSVDMGNPGTDNGKAIALTANRIYVAGVTSSISIGYTLFAVAAFQNGSSPLPLMLVDFTATIQNNMVNLQWKTSSEQNTSYFAVERSENGSDFSSLGQVTAAGNSTTTKDYSFTDQHPLKAINYYRLKMVDADGHFTYSKVVSVTMNAITKKLFLFPNPADDILFVRTSGIQGRADLLITDITGRTIRKNAIQLDGNNTLSVDVKVLAKGIYYLVLQLENSKEVQQFIKN